MCSPPGADHPGQGRSNVSFTKQENGFLQGIPIIFIVVFFIVFFLLVIIV